MDPKDFDIEDRLTWKFFFTADVNSQLYYYAEERNLDGKLDADLCYSENYTDFETLGDFTFVLLDECTVMVFLNSNRTLGEVSFYSWRSKQITKYVGV